MESYLRGRLRVTGFNFSNVWPEQEFLFGIDKETVHVNDVDSQPFFCNRGRVTNNFNADPGLQGWSF